MKYGWLMLLQLGILTTVWAQPNSNRLKHAYPFYEGLSFFREAGKLGLIDGLGNEVLPPNFQIIKPLRAVSAHGELPLGIILASEQRYNRDAKNQWKIYTKSGKLLSKGSFVHVYDAQTGDLIVSKGSSKEGYGITRQWGLIDTAGTVLIPITYRSLQAFNPLAKVPTFIAYKKSGAYFVDRNNKLIRPENYQHISQLKDGYCRVQRNKKWGIVDANTRDLIPCEYDGLGVGTKDKCVVLQDMRWGIINFKGDVVVPFEQDQSISILPSGRTYLKKKGQAALLDSNNKAILPYRMGLKSIQKSEAQFLIVQDKYFNFGLIDVNSSEYVIPSIYKKLELKCTKDEKCVYLAQKGIHYGIINQKNETIVDFEYNWLTALRYSTQLLFVTRKSPFKGLVNGLTGEVLFDCIYEGFEERSGKNKLVHQRRDSIITYHFDPEGIVQKRVATFNTDFGLRRVCKQVNGKWKYALQSYEGNLRTNYFYDRLWPFTSTWAICYQNQQYGLIDTLGQAVLPIAYDKVAYLKNESGYLPIVKIKKDNKWGIYSQYNETLVSLKYSYIDNEFHDGLLLVRMQKGEKQLCGFIDTLGKEVIPIQYEKIHLVGKRLQRFFVIIQENDIFKVLNRTGQPEFSIEFKTLKEALDLVLKEYGNS